MKITKSRGTTVVEITKSELQKYNLTFEKIDCSNIHTKSVIREILFEALGEKSSFQKEIILLPDCDDGCVIVCKEKDRLKVETVSFSSAFSENSEIFCGFFS